MGALAAILAGLAQCAREVVSKRLATQISPELSAGATFLFAVPFYALLLVVMLALGLEAFTITRTFLILVVLRSVTDLFVEAFRMRAFKYGDLSMVMSLICFTPVFLLVLSPVLTGDPLTWHAVVAVALVTTGGLLAVQRNEKTGKVIQKKAVWYALGSAFFLALNTCYDRLAVEQSGPVLSGTAVTLLAGLFTTPILIKGRADLKRFSGSFWWRGLFEFLFMLGRLWGLQHLSGPVVFALTRSSLVCSVIAGRIFFGETHTGRRLVATAIILAGALVAAFA